MATILRFEDLEIWKEAKQRLCLSVFVANDEIFATKTQRHEVSQRGSIIEK